ncbi:MAG: DUF4315 family protein [Lachnospiraceae bacterium]|nr:DUF4315 family protein [Lachnospiraceae bacterium]
MSTKLDRIGAELEKARAKWKEWETRAKDLEVRYREQENQEICGITHSYNLTPDQLAKVLEIVKTMPPESSQAREAMRKVLGEEEQTHEE